MAEVTYSNSISVAEHVVMMILGLVRNYLPSHDWVVKGGWNIADCVERSYDLEGMAVGTVAAGRIGLAVLRRLKPFDVELHYTDRHRLPAEVERGARPHLPPRRRVDGAGLRRGDDQRPAAPRDRAPLRRRACSARMKRGTYLVNTARGKICDRDAVVRALESGQLAGYAGDVWFPQPAPARPPVADDAPRRDDAPHLRARRCRPRPATRPAPARSSSASSPGRPIREEYLIVDGGRLAGAGAHSYSAGNATGGSEEAARFSGS